MSDSRKYCSSPKIRKTLPNSESTHESTNKISSTVPTALTYDTHQSLHQEHLSRFSCDILDRRHLQFASSCSHYLGYLKGDQAPNRYMYWVHVEMTKQHSQGLCWNGSHLKSKEDRNWTLSVTLEMRRSLSVSQGMSWNLLWSEVGCFGRSYPRGLTKSSS